MQIEHVQVHTNLVNILLTEVPGLADLFDLGQGRLRLALQLYHIVLEGLVQHEEPLSVVAGLHLLRRLHLVKYLLKLVLI